MNNNYLETIITYAKSLRLRREEKEEIRQRLVAFMATDMVRKEHFPRQGMYTSIINPYLFPKAMPIALVVLLLVGGGVSFGAEASLPGDLLYPVKVVVNEEVRAAVTLTTEGKAQWEARRAERRLEEAEKLAARGEFNAAARAQVEENFERHAQRTNEHLVRLETTKNFKASADVASRVETSLAVHGRVLNQLAATHNGEVASVAAKVRQAADVVAEARLRHSQTIAVEAQADTSAAAQGSLKAAENKIEEVRVFLTRHRDRFEAQAAAEADAQLIAAANLVVEGKARLEANAYDEAITLFRKAHQRAQEIKVLVQTSQALEVRVAPTRTETEVETKTNIEKKSGEGSIESRGRVELRLGL